MTPGYTAGVYRSHCISGDSIPRTTAANMAERIQVVMIIPPPFLWHTPGRLLLAPDTADPPGFGRGPLLWRRTGLAPDAMESFSPNHSGFQPFVNGGFDSSATGRETAYFHSFTLPVRKTSRLFAEYPTKL